MARKRQISVFEAVDAIRVEDEVADRRQRKRVASNARRVSAVQGQSKIYNHLVECRILMQRSLSTQESSAGSEELLKHLLVARGKLMLHSTEADDATYSDLVLEGKEDNLETVLQEEYAVLKEKWIEVLNRRHHDVKLHSGVTAKNQFKVMDSSFWQQVESTVEYENIRRKGTNSEDQPSFDDSKIYQQILKDFVADSGNSSADSDLQRMKKQRQNSTKKVVDRKASKGRKIRYHEIPKLANFTFPLSRPQTNTLDEDQWFQSLFGGQTVKK